MSKAKTPVTKEQLKKRAEKAALKRARKIVEAADALAQPAESLDEKPVEQVEVVKTAPKVKSKKGRTPWKPANLLTVNDKTDGFRYRWCNNDDRNLAKKKAEGWVKVSKTTGISGKHDRPENTIDGGPMCSDEIGYQDMILLALPEETALDRDKYQAEKVRAQTQSNLVDKLKDGVQNISGSGMSAKLHGSITFD